MRLESLADPVRIRLLSILLTADDRYVRAAWRPGVGLAESTVSHHLGQLRKTGMVQAQWRGMNVYYHPCCDSLEGAAAGAGPELLLTRAQRGA